MDQTCRVLIVGCGNMGGSILQAWLDNGADNAITASNVTVIDPYCETVPPGVTLLSEYPDQLAVPDIVLLAVKPQSLDDVGPKLRPLLGPQSTLVSILAGTELAALDRHFPNIGAIVRLMPNMAVSVGKSPMIMVDKGLDSDCRDLMHILFSPLGPVEWLAEESLMHAATALSGSGPAFLFRFIDALAQGGGKLGLPADQAGRLALYMVEGAAHLASEALEDPGALADKVASPGGTTREGLNVLDKEQKLNRLIAEMLTAARDRSEALSRVADQNQ